MKVCEGRTNPPIPDVWYDAIHQRVIDTINIEHAQRRAECDPPGERELLDFFDRLDAQDQMRLAFLMILCRERFRMSLDYWHRPPLEALDTTGQH